MNILKPVLPSITSDSENDLAEGFETNLSDREISRTPGSQGYSACCCFSHRRRMETGAEPTEPAGPYNASLAATTAKHRTEVSFVLSLLTRKNNHVACSCLGACSCEEADISCPL